MNIVDIKELAKKNGATVQKIRDRLEIQFNSHFNMWMFIDAVEIEIPTFKLFAMDHNKNRIYINN